MTTTSGEPLKMTLLGAMSDGGCEEGVFSSFLPQAEVKTPDKRLKDNNLTRKLGRFKFSPLE